MDKADNKIIYSGKVKDLLITNDSKFLIAHFRDDITAQNGKMHNLIKGKGKLNNEITTLIFNYLNRYKIPNHFVKKINDYDLLIRKANVFPLEIVIRNIAAGSFSKKFGIKEGTELKKPIFEIFYKNDKYDDPMLNAEHAFALDILTPKEYKIIKKLALKINEILIFLFKKMSILLVDFKLEFGKTENDKIILVDEFSPDNARLWDINTSRKLDKDVYRKKTDNIMDVYKIVYSRLKDTLL